MSRWNYEEILSMVIAGKTDTDIAEHFKVTPQCIWKVRKSFGIVTKNRQGHGHKRVLPEAPKPIPIEYEENGQTITRYPMGYAIGAFNQRVTARPRK